MAMLAERPDTFWETFDGIYVELAVLRSVVDSIDCSMILLELCTLKGYPCTLQSSIEVIVSRIY